MASISGRNRAVNGACNIAQLAALTASAGIAGYGGPDQFYAANGNAAGGQFTQSQGTITFGGIALKAVVQTVNTAVASLTTNNFWGGITQPVEGARCYDLLGGPAAISFIFSTNVTGTYSASLRDYSGGWSAANSFVATFAAVAGVPIKVSIPIASIPTSLNTPNSRAGGMYITVGALNTGTFKAASLNAWAVGNFAAASTATNWGATAGNFIALTQLKLEKTVGAGGSTTFDNFDPSDDMNECQDYLYLMPATPYGFPCPSTGGFAFSQRYDFKQTMRAVPSMALNYTVSTNLISVNPQLTTTDYYVVQYVGNVMADSFWTLSFQASAQM